MAVVQERIGSVWHTYSDRDMYIHGGSPESDYAEAYDTVQREYVETDIPIDSAPESEEAYYIEAGKILLGEKKGAD